MPKQWFRERKIIWLLPDTHQALTLIKKAYGLRNMDETIQFLLSEFLKRKSV